MLWALLACAPPPAAHPIPTRRSHARSETFNVDCGGSAEFTTIAEAIDAADSGDRIEVAPCTYAEQVDFKGRAVTIVATGGPEVTTILAPEGEPAVRVHRGEGTGTVLDGFTVSGGGGKLEPAIEEQFSTLTLRDVVISGTGGTETIYARSGVLTLERVTIDTTNTPSTHQLIYGRRGGVVVKDSVVSCGADQAGFLMEHGAAFVDGATFECPGVHAAAFYHSGGRVQRSAFDGALYVENETTSSEQTRVEGSVFRGGIVAVYTLLILDNVVLDGLGVTMTDTALTLRSSIVTGATCGVSSTRSSLSVSWTDFWNNTTDVCGERDPLGTNGNIDADPLFEDADAHDYRLGTGSPAIDAGSTGEDDVDLDGTRNDMGAFGGPFTQEGG